MTEPLKSFIKALENRDSDERRNIIISELEKNRVPI